MVTGVNQRSQRRRAGPPPLAPLPMLDGEAEEDGHIRRAVRALSVPVARVARADEPAVRPGATAPNPPATVVPISHRLDIGVERETRRAAAASRHR